MRRVAPLLLVVGALALAGCSDDSATTASNAAAASATTSTQGADSTIKRITAPTASKYSSVSWHV